MNKEKTDIIFSLGEDKAREHYTGELPDYLHYGFTEDDVIDLIALTADDKLRHARDSDFWVPIHAWRVLGQLGAQQAIKPLLDIFDDLMETDNDWALSELPCVMGLIGPSAIVPLASYMRDKRHTEYARVMAMDGLCEIAKKDATVRADILTIYRAYLKDPDLEMSAMNGLLLACTLDLDGKELAEDIRPLFDKECVDLGVVGDMEDVEIALGLRDERETPRLSFEQMYGISREYIGDMTQQQILDMLDKELEKPTDEEDVVAWLNYYVMFYGNDDSVLDASELDGFCAALACSPEMIVPSTWIPAMWGGEELMPEWESVQEAQHFNEFLFIAYNHVISALNDNQYEPLFWLSNVDGKQGEMVDEWCGGFLKGVDLWGALSSIDAVIVDKALAPIRLFATQSGFEKLRTMTVDEIEQHQGLIEPATKQLFLYFLENRNDLVSPVTRNEAKIGRNDPCPCGSGKKYKKCCLH